eukprot:bmy_02823T0
MDKVATLAERAPPALKFSTWVAEALGFGAARWRPLHRAYPTPFLLLKLLSVCLGENWWPAEKGLSPRRPSLFTDPEVPFSWSEEDISDLYGHTTILLAAEGEGASAAQPVSPRIITGRLPPRLRAAFVLSSVAVHVYQRFRPWGLQRNHFL